MSRSPEEIRAEIDATRADLSTNVNTLADSANPATVARRQVGRLRSAVAGTREKVMGAAPDVADARASASSTLQNARDGVGGAASSAGEVLASSPDLIRDKTQGNPFAAGLIAFGIGWLAASLLPATDQEQRAVAALRDSAQPVLDEVSDIATAGVENLREPAQEAAQALKNRAQDAVEHTKQEGADAAGQVRNDAQDAATAVQDTRS